jgi:hypothetical protein
MAKNNKSREELIEELNLLKEESCKQFYYLPHEQKASIDVFEDFCQKHNGVYAIILSDNQICDNKDLIIIAAKYGLWAHLELLSERLLADADVALALAECNRHEYRKINKSLRENPDLMLNAIKINPFVFSSLPVKVRTDRKILMHIAKYMPSELSWLKDIRKELKHSIFSDRELALLVAQSGPYALNLFNDDVLNDKEIIETAFCVNSPLEMKERLIEYSWGFKYLDKDKWIEDKDLIIKALENDGSIYANLPYEYQADRAISYIAVKSDSKMIECCPANLRDNKKIVLAALQDDSENVLAFVSKRLQDDFDVVFKAVSVDPLNLEFASERLRDDRKIVLRAIKTFGGALDYASARLQEDVDLIKISEENS